jgi:hypothetical protein
MMAPKIEAKSSSNWIYERNKAFDYICFERNQGLSTAIKAGDLIL